MSPFTPFIIPFADHRTAFALRDVPPDADPTAVLEALQLPAFSGVLATIVGAGSMSPDILEATRNLLIRGLAPVAEELRLLVVDGGTRFGGMMAMGDARQAIGGTFPLVGVLPIGAAVIPDELDPFHSHFVLVNGDRFGDEARMLPGLLRGSDKPGATLIVDGRADSPIIPLELPFHARWADVLIAVRHSGGLPDALLDPNNAAAAYLPQETTLLAVDLDQPEALAGLLRQVFVER